jgi:hypothetical protein
VNLDKFNTPQVANSGLALGGFTIAVRAGILLALITNPGFLLQGYWAIVHVRQHAVTQADLMTFATLAGAVIGLAAANAIALVRAYLGKPSTLNSKETP